MVTAVVGAISETYITLHTGISKTAYEEKLYFYVPEWAGTVRMRVLAFKPQDQVLEHSHGTHDHKARADANYNSAHPTTSGGSYWTIDITSVEVGSGTSPVTAAYPDGFKVRVNGSTEYGPYGDGSADVQSDWIDITNDITKGAINYIEYLSNTAGCKAIIQIAIL